MDRLHCTGVQFSRFRLSAESLHRNGGDLRFKLGNWPNGRGSLNQSFLQVAPTTAGNRGSASGSPGCPGRLGGRRSGKLSAIL